MYKISILTMIILFGAGCASAVKPVLMSPLTVEFCATQDGKDHAVCTKPFDGSSRTVPKSEVGNICMTADEYIKLMKFFRKYCSENSKACSWKYENLFLRQKYKGSCSVN